MPPTIPAALSRRAAQSTSASSVTSLTRAFSCTSIHQSTKIPPESPLFINVPTPPLSQAVEDKRPDRFAKKGHLPLPRRIFKRRTYELPKTSPVFLSKSAPLPTSAKAQLPPASEHDARRREMADMRRKNLTEGIEELWKRRKDTEKARRKHREAKQWHHKNAMNAPQRDDEAFTESSIPAAVLQTHVPQDPLRFEHGLQSKARTDAIVARKSQDRKDALQKLYMSARSFIVDEKVLESEVDKLFRPDTFSSGISETGAIPENAWGYYGKPLTVRELMGDVMRTDNKILNISQEEGSRTSKRQIKVAEELTGGPMDDA
ncbi:hypothetical protein BKA67DRAFT_202829 [Truncatella angustata]|uniref:Uncharacterized protein n=1 Tax=Truncatella angustata TaxID=152316 RepID=A0A9P9A046_9PEZI|nr:uncharacterized protein BKA67DRAFT_202829 [Truncatella angustata]KAH6657947.1 hypothetical protein BKA67DRAFT_202829 [Truncatella angustata]KAH8195903.1 hypothetical protein TruAng_009916 [Truncatella angustata]